VVWNHNTAVSRSTGFTPFKLLFGDEAITLEEARTGSIITLASTEDEGDCQITKDTIEGTRLQAIEHINKYQAETIKWSDIKVRLKNIKPCHLVIRRVANPDIVGKLQLKWEGPFLVVSSSRLGSYRLKYMDDNDIPGLGMQMSFDDIMYKQCNFLIFPMAPFSFQEGRKVFNGAIGCNFHFLFSPLQYKAKFPHM
jgi:hypothetical protein